jgi:hypothetical protein
MVEFRNLRADGAVFERIEQALIGIGHFDGGVGRNVTSFIHRGFLSGFTGQAEDTPAAS